MAGREGFEPPNGRVKTGCLKPAWRPPYLATSKKLLVEQTGLEPVQSYLCAGDLQSPELGQCSAAPPRIQEPSPRRGLGEINQLLAGFPGTDLLHDHENRYRS